MFYKCELLVGGRSYDATDCLVNWEDVELAYKRGDYDGVVRSFSTKFEFSGAAYSALVGEWQENYLQASASVVFYRRGNSWLWNELFRCALDFSTFAYGGTTCEINAVDDSLASLIKAKRGTEYEYAVANIREDVPLHYDRMSMTNTVTWLMTGDYVENEGGEYIENTYQQVNDDAVGRSNYAIPIYVKTSEFAVKNVAEAYDVQLEYDGTISGTRFPFFKNVSDHGLRVNIKGNFQLFMRSGGNGSALLTLTMRYGSGKTFLHTQNLAEGYNDVQINLSDILLVGGAWLCFQIGVLYADCTVYQMMPYASNETLVLTFNDTDVAIDIDAVKPLTLLNRLLKSMNGGEDGITGEIASGVDMRLDNTLLLAAESIRGLEGAKLHTSYTKFCNWMSAEFGFVPVVDDTAKKVTFVHRDSLFKDTEVKDLGGGCTEFQYTVNEGLIYTRVRVGYDRVDYDSVNGRDEFRFTNSYDTGVTLTDTSLDLISPYRADAYGIEFLAAKRGEDTTDDGSDNDVFMAGAALKADGTCYELLRGGDYAVTGVISPETMFNGMYAQRFMVAANEKYIGVFADTLKFASAEGNGDAAVGGVRTDADLTLAGRLFTVGEVEVETGDQQLPTDLGGYITLEKNGRTYQGYLKDASFGVGKAQAVRYTLVVK